MKSQEDLFSKFQKGSEELSIRPNSEAWSKLEKRLDQLEKRNLRVVMIRRLAAVAAVLVLVVGFYFISQFSRTQDLASDKEPAPAYLEDLVNTAGCQPYCMLLEGRRELPDYYANPVRK